MGKLVIASVVAAIVLFSWGYVAHMFLSLGSMGLKPLPASAVTALHTAVSESGMYVYPFVDPDTATADSMKEAEAQALAGPVVIMAYDHDGREMMPPSTMGIEFATNVLSALLAALVLMQVAGGFASRLFCVTLLGLFAGLTVNVPLWNWYGFSDGFTIAALIMHGVGWFLAGIPLAIMVKRDRSS